MRSSKQHFSSLRRCRVYFVVIALVMTTTLLFLTYGWNFSLKINRLSNNKNKALFPTTRIVPIGGHHRNTTAIPAADIRRNTFNNSSRLYNESKFVDPRLKNILKTSHETKDMPKSSPSVKLYVNESTLSTFVDKNNKNITLKTLDGKNGNIGGTGGGSEKHTAALVQTTKLHHVEYAADHSEGGRGGDKRQDDVGRRKHPKGADKLHGRTKLLNDTDKVTVEHVTVTQSEISVDKPSKPHKDSINKVVGNVTKTSQTGDTAKSVATNDNSSDNMSDNQHQTSTISSENDNEITSQTGVSNSVKSVSTHKAVIPTKLTSVHDLIEEQLKNKYISSLKWNQLDKGSHRFETISTQHNDLLEQLKRGLWNGRTLIRRTQAVPRSPNTTVRPEMCKGCFKTDFKQLIDSPDLCKTSSDIQVLIMVSSSPGKHEAREVIRNTWGHVCYEKNSGVKCVFVFGEHKNSDINKALVEESSIHQDIIQYAFRDTYANLTFKTMVSLKWASEKCQQAKYVMKTDDDMYVNTELLPLAMQGAPDTNFLGGYCWGPSAPHRDMSSKWYVSFEQFAQSSYPKMCSGTGYVMSKDVAIKVLRQSVDIPFFYLEDVYMSLCLKKLGIQPILLNGFSNTRIEFDPCSYRNQVITSHELSPSELQRIWSEIQKCPKANLTPAIAYSPRLF